MVRPRSIPHPLRTTTIRRWATPAASQKSKANSAHVQDPQPKKKQFGSTHERSPQPTNEVHRSTNQPTKKTVQLNPRTRSIGKKSNHLRAPSTHECMSSGRETPVLPRVRAPSTHGRTTPRRESPVHSPSGHIVLMRAVRAQPLLPSTSDLLAC